MIAPLGMQIDHLDPIVSKHELGLSYSLNDVSIRRCLRLLKPAGEVWHHIATLVAGALPLVRVHYTRVSPSYRGQEGQARFARATCFFCVLSEIAVLVWLAKAASLGRTAKPSDRDTLQLSRTARS